MFFAVMSAPPSSYCMAYVLNADGGYVTIKARNETVSTAVWQNDFDPQWAQVCGPCISIF